MDKPYSPVVYKNLIAFHLAIAPVLILLAISINPYDFFMVPSSIIVFTYWSILTIRLQNKNNRLGLFAIPSILCDTFIFVLFLKIFLQGLIFKGYIETPLFFFIFGVIFILFSIHFYVLSSAIYPLSPKRLQKSFYITIVFFMILSGSFAYKYIRTLNPNHWPVLNAKECGYQIQYSPKLRAYGGRFWGQTCGYWDLGDIARIIKYETEDQGTNFSLKNWAMLVWPSVGSWTDYSKLFYSFGDSIYTRASDAYFGRSKDQWLVLFKENTQKMFKGGESMNINGYDAFKVYPNNSRYIVFIRNREKMVVKFECTYKNDEELNFCNKSLDSFKFIDS